MVKPLIIKRRKDSIFTMNGLEELAFGEEDAGSYWFSWANYKGIPPVLVARLRLKDKPLVWANS
jgi:hypothetical protein